MSRRPPRSPASRAPVGAGHGPAQPVRQQPGRPVAADARLRLELQRGDAVGMRGDEMRGEEPCPERQVAAARHRARRHRGLASAPRAPGRRRPPSAPGLSRSRRPDTRSRRPSAAWPGARRRHRRPGKAPRTPGGTWAGRVCIAMPWEEHKANKTDRQPPSDTKCGHALVKGISLLP